MSALISLKQQVITRAAGSPLGQRWQQLPPRDRMALALLGGFVLLALLYLMIWQPVARQGQDARSYYQQQRELHAYLQANADLARQQAGRPQADLAPDQLQGLVTQSAKEHGLTIERFDSDGDGLLVSLAQAPFANLLRWFSELEAQGVRLAEVSLDRAENGKVDARVTMKAG
jgi:general secretion pathway protein M